MSTLLPASAIRAALVAEHRRLLLESLNVQVIAEVVPLTSDGKSKLTALRSRLRADRLSWFRALREFERRFGLSCEGTVPLALAAPAAFARSEAWPV